MLLSLPYPIYSGTLSRYALTCHGTSGFSDNFTQLWLSQYIQVASNWRSNKSDSSFLSNTASQLEEQDVTYSASAVLSDMQNYFLLNQGITPDPILKQHLEVLFRSMALPAQSE